MHPSLTQFSDGQRECRLTRDLPDYAVLRASDFESLTGPPFSEGDSIPEWLQHHIYGAFVRHKMPREFAGDSAQRVKLPRPTRDLGNGP